MVAELCVAIAIKRPIWAAAEDMSGFATTEDILAKAELCAELVGVKDESMETKSKEPTEGMVGVIESEVVLFTPVPVPVAVSVPVTCMAIMAMEEGPIIEAPALDKAELKAWRIPLAWKARLEERELGTMVIVG